MITVTEEEVIMGMTPMIEMIMGIIMVMDTVRAISNLMGTGMVIGNLIDTRNRFTSSRQSIMDRCNHPASVCFFH
jgi:Na+/H+-dicarboxylate symporter